MEWTRSETLALAMHNCTQCHGCGLRLRNIGDWTPCNCVLRAMFRICYDRFRRCSEQERHLSRVSVEPRQGPTGRGHSDEKTRNIWRIFVWYRGEILANPSISCFDITFSWGRIGRY